MAALLGKLGIKSALFVLPEGNSNVERSARNIPYVKVLSQEGINVEDVLRHEHLVLTTATVEKLQERQRRPTRINS